MPSESTLSAFVARVESADFVGALESYYHPDASMQENDEPPRQGLDASIANEKAFMKGFASIAVQAAGAPLVDGDTVVVRWRFVFTLRNGTSVPFEEVAWQTWRGERIASEKFFYDPKQFAPLR
jgi:hypothetical protein